MDRSGAQDRARQAGQSDQSPVQELVGGNLSAVTRVGETVHRTAGPWTPTIHRLLAHLHRRGVDWVPRPLGFAPDGREIVSFIPGTVPHYPLPAWIWTDEVLVAAGRHLAAFHEATRDFAQDEARWQQPAHEPAEVICHNDFAPYNMVFTGQTLSGLIDCDTASPGPRVWDVAYLAYRLVPLTAPANRDGLTGDLTERRRRLALLIATYGHDLTAEAIVRVAVPRLRELADFAEGRAEQGAAEMRDHARLYRDDAAWIAARGAELGG